MVAEPLCVKFSMKIKIGRHDRGQHPSLRPAFRVRRGWRAKCLDMTGYDGPRASGSPPDPNAFSALHWSYAPTATTSAGASAILPSISLVRAVQVKAFGSGGEPINKVTFSLTRQHVLTDSSADARGPTTSADQIRDRALRVGFSRALDHGRSSEKVPEICGS